MKKINLGLILLEAIILMVPSVVIGYLLNLVLFRVFFKIDTEVMSADNTFLWVMCIATYIVLMTSTFISINEKFAKKTMDKNTQKHNFQNYSTFYASSSILRIDPAAGKVAYVSKFNPFRFYIVPAGEMTDIKSDYMKGILGGTRYVYFEFKLNNKRMRFPTFTSRQMYSLEHSLVVTGLSKADLYAELLTTAKNVATGARNNG